MWSITKLIKYIFSPLSTNFTTQSYTHLRNDKRRYFQKPINILQTYFNVKSSLVNAYKLFHIPNVVSLEQFLLLAALVANQLVRARDIDSFKVFVEGDGFFCKPQKLGFALCPLCVVLYRKFLNVCE